MPKLELLHQETNVSPLTMSVYYRGFHQTKKNHKYLKPLYFKNSFVVFKGDRIDWYGYMENFKDIATKIIDDFKKDRTYSQRLLKDVITIGNKLYKENKSILKSDLSKLSNKQLAVKIKKIYQWGQDISDLGMVAVIPDLRHNIFSKYLKERIQHKIYYYVLKGKVNDYFSILITPSKRGYIYKEKLVLINLAKEINKDKKLATYLSRQDSKKILALLKKDHPKLLQKLNKVMADFMWLNFGQIGPAKTQTQYIDDLKNLFVAKTFNQEYKSLLNEDKILIRQQEKFIKELHLNPLEKSLFKTARDFTYNKVYRFDQLLFTYYVLDKILKEIAKRINWQIKDLRYCSLEEVVKLLNNKNSLKKVEIKERQKYSLLVIKGKGVEFIVGQKVSQFLKRNVNEEKIKKDITIIHGTTAYLGLAVGTVKIVNSPKDLNKIKPGDILVSVQTNPELLPAMKMAGAFVTDIGGITSHAAIVARELKKPCIVGTRVATRVLKDGDKVEVDASHGDVKKV